MPATVTAVAKEDEGIRSKENPSGFDSQQHFEVRGDTSQTPALSTVGSVNRANWATRDWTALPPDWEPLRRRWEYSHAASAILNFVAFVSLVVAALIRR